MFLFSKNIAYIKNNVKRILHKIPGVKTKIGTYATALYLLKQHVAGQVEEEYTIERTFHNWLVDNGYTTEEELDESVDNTQVIKGRYTYFGDSVVLYTETPVDRILGQNIYKAVHQDTSNEVFVTLGDLK